MLKLFNTKRGFSLVEMIVYVSILVFMLVIIMQVTVSVIRSERIIRSARVIENSAVVSLERLSRELRQADSVRVASSTFGTHPGVLMLQGRDDSGAARTVEFRLTGGRLQMRENGVDLGILSEEKVQIRSLIFHRFATSTTEGVRTVMTLESGTTTNYKTETFYSSTLLR